jgi:hypothetical protein
MPSARHLWTWREGALATAIVDLGRDRQQVEFTGLERYNGPLTLPWIPVRPSRAPLQGLCARDRAAPLLRRPAHEEGAHRA